MKFADLVASLKPLAQAPLLQKEMGGRIASGVGAPHGYVEPTLELVEDAPTARVVLIQAAGAVGKSAAARALASRLNWPLVRAEKAQVGSFSLTGLLHSALGSEYLTAVDTGRAGVIIDALDEAHLKAGTSNLLEFLENVRTVAESEARDGRSASIILFSRVDTAELIRISFDDANTPLAVMSLSFFEKSAAEKFIENHLTRRHDEVQDPKVKSLYNVARAWQVPYGQLRDLRISQVMSRLVGGARGRYCEVLGSGRRLCGVRSCTRGNRGVLGRR